MTHKIKWSDSQMAKVVRSCRAAVLIEMPVVRTIVSRLGRSTHLELSGNPCADRNPFPWFYTFLRGRRFVTIDSVFSCATTVYIFWTSDPQMSLATTQIVGVGW